MGECSNCEYFDISTNKCLIDGRKGYYKGEPLISDCDNYEQGHWGTPEEIEVRNKCIQ